MVEWGLPADTTDKCKPWQSESELGITNGVPGTAVLRFLLKSMCPPVGLNLVHGSKQQALRLLSLMADYWHQDTVRRQPPQWRHSTGGACPCSARRKETPSRPTPADPVFRTLLGLSTSGAHEFESEWGPPVEVCAVWAGQKALSGYHCSRSTGTTWLTIAAKTTITCVCWIKGALSIWDRKGKFWYVLQHLAVIMQQFMLIAGTKCLSWDQGFKLSLCWKLVLQRRRRWFGQRSDWPEKRTKLS